MIKHISLIASMLLLIATGAHAQDSNQDVVMICKTSDGPVTITEHTVKLADYTLNYDGVVTDGVVRYTDPAHNTIAVLDARADDGLYLEVHEKNSTMQVVAARTDITYRTDKNGTEPSSPTWSSVMQMFRRSPEKTK